MLPKKASEQEIQSLFQSNCVSHPGNFEVTPGQAIRIVRTIEGSQLRVICKFQMGDKVRKTKGSQWHGTVVGWYSTSLTPEGYAVESSTEKGSVQIYPAAALEMDKEPINRTACGSCGSVCCNGECMGE